MGSDLSKENTFNPLEGEVILIDKDLKWTSFDVVKRIRNLIYHELGVKKCKVGHAGTLDPLATGLLIICTGRMTKKITSFQDTEKEYTGRIRFGQTTPSLDLETEVDQEFPWEHLTEAFIETSMQKFIGEILQTPPVFSAKKIDGKRAYHSARAGTEIKMRQQLITVSEFELTATDLPEIEFRVVCSKGTYVRTLAGDLGKALDSGAHLIELRRTRSGDHHVDHAMKMDAFEKYVQECALKSVKNL